MLTSRIVRALLNPMVMVMSISAVVGLYETALSNGVLAELAPGFPWPDIAVKSDAFGISTFALSLLLVFRTNSSYDRLCEAQGYWDDVVTHCRDLSRQAGLWLLPGRGAAPACTPPPAAAATAESDADLALRAALARWLKVLPFALMERLREGGAPGGRGGGGSMGGDADSGAATMARQLPTSGLTAAEEALLLGSRHAAHAALMGVSACVARCGASENEKQRMDENVSRLEAALAGCERLYAVPIPLSYTRHTSRFLVIWLTCMPFVIWHELGWASVLVGALMAFLLFGIEEIGVQIEEPFGIMPLEMLCDEVAASVDQTMAEAELLLGMQLPPAQALAGPGGLAPTPLQQPPQPLAAPSAAALAAVSPDAHAECVLLG